MIFDAIFDFLLAPISLLLDVLDVLPNGITIPTGIFNGLNNLFGLIGYIFPVKQLLPILAISLSLTGLQFGVTFFRSIISLIPTEGG